MADKIKLFVAFLLVAAGIAGYYYLHDSAAGAESGFGAGRFAVGRRRGMDQRIRASVFLPLAGIPLPRRSVWFGRLARKRCRLLRW